MSKSGDEYREELLALGSFVRIARRRDAQERREARAQWRRENGGGETPKGTILSGLVKKLWLTETSDSWPVLVALFEARENEGDEAEFNGWHTRDYMPLMTTTRPRWAPFLEVTGIQLRDLLGRKCRLFVEEHNDQVGVPIERIGDWVPGEDNDKAWVRVIAKVEINGDYKIDKWLRLRAAPD